MKITSLKVKACVLTTLGLALTGAVIADDKSSDKEYKQSQQRATEQYGTSAAVGAPMPANKASALIGMAVNDQTGEKLGDIKDLVLDVQGGKVAYSVFGTDGKERMFAIPLSAYQAGPNHKHLVLNIDRTKFDSAQGFEKDNWPTLNSDFQKDAFWTVQAGRFSAQADVDAGAAGAKADVAVQSEPQSSEQEELTATGKDQSFRAGSGAITDHNKASKLLGMNIKNQQGENLGEIKDLVIDLQSGRVSYAVLAYGGTLGIGQKMVAVPLTAFSFGAEEKALVLNADKSRLERAQGFDKNNWPSVSNPTWGADRFWEEKNGTTGQYNQGRQGQQGQQNEDRTSPPDPDQTNPQP